LKPLLRSRVAWGSTMWDWVMDLLPLFMVTSFRVPFRMAVLPFLNTVFSLCQMNTLWMTAPPQKTIPSPMTTEVTMAGVSLK